MSRATFAVSILASLIAGCALQTPARADVPDWLPRYDLEIDLDTAGHSVHVKQRVVWTNRHERSASELVFNAHSHYRVPSGNRLLLAKTLELLRVVPEEAIEGKGASAALRIERVTMGDLVLRAHYQEGNGRALDAVPPANCDPESAVTDCDGTALVVMLPHPVRKGESIAVELEFSFRLPQKQGRWGQWRGVTFLSNWLPVLAVYDESGWQPTPYIPWHQPFFNEAGIYSARATLPQDQQIACTCSIEGTSILPDGRQQVDFQPRCARDFAFLCSARYQAYTENVGAIQVRCMAFPEHEYYARALTHWACEAIPVYERWIGPFPYPVFTIVESYFGWSGNECGGLVMIDERVFGMPHIADGYPEYLISHELCHQWWYNAIGTNGYSETFMDEAMAVHYSHRLMTQKHGRNNALIHYPSGLEWLPNIHRDSYRAYGLLGTIARGEATTTLHDMQDFGSVVTLFSMAYDKGGKIVDMIEDRLGEAGYCDFIHTIYARYQFRILRVADFQRELGEYTGQKAVWDEFFNHWLYGAGFCDWAVDKVTVEPVNADGTPAGPRWSFVRALHGQSECSVSAYRVTVLVTQKAEYTEPTVLGFCFDGSDDYQLRIPIDPGVQLMDFDNPRARVQTLTPTQVQVEVVLPRKPTQISVDPDQIIVDPNPVNNHWKPKIRWRWTPFNNPLEETDVTNDYDKLNIIFGPGFQGSAYADPWYAKSPVLGLRGDLYRTQDYSLAGYTGYRTDYQDLVVGADGLIDHFPWPHTQVGFNAERSLTTIEGTDDGRHSDRLAFFGRYVFLYNSSLYLPPIHYIEAFGGIRDNNLPLPKTESPGADHFDQQTFAGLHYHLDLQTPYWDPAMGFTFDATVATGIPIFGEERAFNSFETQLSQVQKLPECLGPLGQSKLAYRIYAAGGLPNDGQYFTLGGSQLFRGYDLQERQGSLVWIGSLEWRVPIISNVEWDACDHVIGLRNFYTAAFYDVGNAYVNGHQTGPVAHALGLGLRLDVAWLSFIERSTLRFDIAKTIDSSAPWQFWFGVQAPF